jgi:hypothetical protein
MNTKELIESIISDLLGDASISKIMLKTQALAMTLNSDKLLDWVYLEQRGYPDIDILPKYRVIGCTVKACINNGIIQYPHRPVPIEAIRNESDRDFLSHIHFTKPISEIEGYTNYKDGKDGKRIMYTIPVQYYSRIENIFGSTVGSVQVENAWKESTIESVKSIIDLAKSHLLSLLLDLNQVIGANLNNLSASMVNTATQQYIYDSIVHNGDGCINITNSNFATGDNSNISLSPHQKDEINAIIDQINSIQSQLDEDETDIAECIVQLQTELNSKVPCPKTIKLILRALKSFPKIAAEKTIEYGINNLLNTLLL